MPTAASDNLPVNFDLSIERSDYNFLAIVRNSPAGMATAPISIPIHKQELFYFWQQMAYEFENLDAEVAGQHIGQYSRAQDLGERLFRFVFPTSIQSMLSQSAEIAYERRQQMRLRIILSEVPELSYLPWEYLYEPSQQTFLALSPRVSLVRHIDRLHQIPPIAVSLPLRMLVVIPSPNNLQSFDKEREWLALIDTLDHLALAGKLIIEQLRAPTPFDLQRQLRQKQYHILHFIGYGEYDEFAQDGMIFFEDQTGRGRTVSGQHVGSMLRDHNTLRLVNLNLRQFVDSAAGWKPTLPSPFLQAAESIAKRGIPGVITLPQEMPPVSMLTFYDELLSALTEFKSVDVAVAQARRAVLDGQQSAAWGVPVCMTRAVDGQLFSDAAATPPERQLNQPNDEIRSLRLRYWS